MAQAKYVCAVPSHFPVIERFVQETLHRRISNEIVKYKNAGMPDQDVVSVVTSELIPQLGFLRMV